MFQHQQIWLPDGERHFPEWMDKNGELVDGKGTYQLKKIRETLKACKSFRRAVDVGAHVGLWSMQLAKRFAFVDAFEPMKEFRECWEMNVLPSRRPEQLTLHPVALGDAYTSVAMQYDPHDSGNTHVVGPGSVPMQPLDYYQFPDVDLLKVDCEGYEHKVISGAFATVTRCWPTIIVEQKAKFLKAHYGLDGTPAVDLLRGWGYRTHAILSGDYIMVPRDGTGLEGQHGAA